MFNTVGGRSKSTVNFWILLLFVHQPGVKTVLISVTGVELCLEFRGAQRLFSVKYLFYNLRKAKKF